MQTSFQNVREKFPEKLNKFRLIKYLFRFSFFLQRLRLLLPISQVVDAKMSLDFVLPGIHDLRYVFYEIKRLIFFFTLSNKLVQIITFTHLPLLRYV